MQAAGWSLLIAGLLVLVGYGVFLAKGFFTDATIPLAIRVAVPAVVVGFLLLLGAVIRDRVRKKRQEYFKEIEP